MFFAIILQTCRRGFLSLYTIACVYVHGPFPQKSCLENQENNIKDSEFNCQRKQSRIIIVKEKKKLKITHNVFRLVFIYLFFFFLAHGTTSDVIFIVYNDQCITDFIFF